MKAKIRFLIFMIWITGSLVFGGNPDGVFPEHFLHEAGTGYANPDIFPAENIALSGQESKGNAPITKAPEIVAIPGATVNVPVTVTGFSNIGAISLTLNFNASVMTFQSFTNTSGFPGLSATNPSSGKIVIGGFSSSSSGYSLSSGATLITLKFTFIGGNTALTWHDNGSSCEYSGPAPMYPTLNDIPASTYYINGSITNATPSLSGTVTYNSNTGSGTPMSNVTVSLKNESNVVLSSVTTNTSGNYAFYTATTGAKRLEVSSPASWGGVNSTDALAVLQRTVGLPMNFWNPEIFIDKVADVNTSSTISASDALNISLRTIAMINSFQAGDWSFYTDELNFTNSTANTAWISYSGQTQINIKALCYGDVNSSYTVQNTKSSEIITNSRNINVNNGSEFEIPVRLLTSDEIGAATIFLEYDPGIIHISKLETHVERMIYSLEENKIKLAWCGLNPLETGDDGCIVTLTGVITDDIPSNATIFKTGSETEFAGPDNHILDGVSIDIPAIICNTSITSDISQDIFSVKCYPNPVKDLLNVDIALKDDMKVELSINDTYGRKLIELFNDEVNSGHNHFQFRLNQYELPKGIYFLKLYSTGAMGYFNYNQQIKIIIP